MMRNMKVALTCVVIGLSVFASWSAWRLWRVDRVVNEIEKLGGVVDVPRFPLLGHEDISMNIEGRPSLLDDESFQRLQGYLTDFSVLRLLDLHGTNLTDKGIDGINRLSTVRELDLSGTKITDASVSELVQLPSLEWLNISDTQVTEEGVEKLQKALPSCNILH